MIFRKLPCPTRWLLWSLLFYPSWLAASTITSQANSGQHQPSGCHPTDVTTTLAKTGGYLPDFSYAGYQWGESPTDIDYQLLDVTDYGVIANDGIDDTPAMLKALLAAHQIATPVNLLFPPGTVLLSQPIFINRSFIRLQGAGDGSTVLAFDRPLLQLPESILAAYQIDKKKEPPAISPVSWRGGFIWAHPIADGTHGKPEIELQSGQRGKFEVGMLDTSSLTVGDVITVRWCRLGCDLSSFTEHLMDHQPVTLGKGFANMNGLVSQYLTVTGIGSDSIRVKEPLAHDIKPDWQVMQLATNMLEQVHLDGFTIQFPELPYAGHHQEQGFNGVYLHRVSQSSVSNVTVEHADNAFFMNDSTTSSLSNIEVRGREGHYSIAIEDSNHILVTDFALTASMLHNPSVGWGAELNVYRRGRIEHARIEQHKGLNQQNLFESLDVHAQKKRRVFSLGGNRLYGPTSAAFNTFWDVAISAAEGQFSAVTDAPSARLVGVDQLPEQYGPGAFIDSRCIAEKRLESLYIWQLTQRLAEGENQHVANSNDSAPLANPR
ncbi:glycoside hydrolase family 55 protein [Neiella marina]|uniref:Glycoside hydrolase family 55 protein n=1 Tax=Neiella holothuriorum TaxID=2870530 RepID=A0ABS7EGM3_9GAMM|nr:glycoside hydrolase family 55 protein [Neiella holothuriorum]MBW8191458.1 glycoside hydrolase family 55 protein [Neiella holothuriorum]